MFKYTFKCLTWCPFSFYIDFLFFLTSNFFSVKITDFLCRENKNHRKKAKSGRELQVTINRLLELKSYREKRKKACSVMRILWEINLATSCFLLFSSLFRPSHCRITMWLKYTRVVDLWQWFFLAWMFNSLETFSFFLSLKLHNLPLLMKKRKRKAKLHNKPGEGKVLT